MLTEKQSKNHDDNEMPVGIFRKWISRVRLSALFGIKGYIFPGRFKVLPQQLRGAILGIGISIIPLLVVIVISNGMIDGITRRLIEVNSYHIQVTLFGRTSRKEIDETKAAIQKIETVKFVFLERDGFVQIRHKNSISGATLRCVPKELFEKDEGFKRYFKTIEGVPSLTRIPDTVSSDIMNNKILVELDGTERELLLSAYEKDGNRKLFSLKQGLDNQVLAEVERIFFEHGFSVVLLGKSLADTISAQPGDLVYLLSLVEFHSRMIPKSYKVIVKGIFSTGYQYIDKFLAYIPYETGITLLPERGSKEFIGIKVKDPFDKIDNVVRQIDKIIGAKMISANPESWYDLQRNQYNSFQLTRSILILIMALIILVAVANVYSTVSVIVMDRTLEIAILKSMGASPSSIMLSFILTGFYAGAIGTFIGLISGLLVAVNINEVFKGVEFIVNFFLGIIRIFGSPLINTGENKPFIILNPEFYLEKIPIKIGLIEAAIIGFFTIFFATISAWFPAWKAGKIRPLEIIRKY